MFRILYIRTKREVNLNAPAKIFQEKYLQKYFEICDELQSEMQVEPKPQHFQYLGDDNKYHLIELEGVMLHPNDKAMQVYADRIYNALISNK